MDINIIRHPVKDGWLIATPQITNLLNAPHELLLPDDTKVHPLYLFEPDFGPGDLETVRTWALAIVRQMADERIKASDDGLLQVQYVYDEIRRYDLYLNDPANQPTPNAARYKNAAAVASSLNVSLTAVLDEFRSRWIASYIASANIVAERQRVIAALKAPNITIAQIEQILSSLNWQ